LIVGDLPEACASYYKVVDYVAANSVGNPVLIFGDTNSRYTRTLDNIPSIVSQAGLTDAWVQLARSGKAPAAGSTDLLCPDGVPTNTSCEVVDKVLYRGSKAITLQATSFNYDTSRFLSTDLATLTDHNPVRVEFSWAWGSFRQSDLYGGPHG
jgi:hypothetical protein